MATLKAYRALDMFSPTIFYGNLVSYDESHITLSNGVRAGTYYGTFTYSSVGLTGGTITGYDAYLHGVLTTTVRGGHANALTLDGYLSAGAANQAYSYAFRSADTMNGSGLADGMRGYAGSDILYGNGGNDILQGDTGNDILIGGSGSDTLKGGDGNDVLRGLAAADVLTGSQGADRFDFETTGDSKPDNPDTIRDFRNGDKIDLSTIDANSKAAGNQKFSFIGTDPFTKAGQVRFDPETERLLASTDADSHAEFSILLPGVDSMTDTNFIL